MSVFDRPKNHEPIPWRHGVLTTPLYTAVTVYAAGLSLGVAAEHGAHLPTGFIAAGTGLGVVSACAARLTRTWTRGKTARWLHTAFTATWTTAAATWLNWTVAGTPWTMASAVTIASATAALVPLYGLDRSARADEIAGAWADAEARAKVAMGEWERAFEAAGARGVTVTSDPVNTRAGYELKLQFSPGGTDFTGLNTVLPKVAMAKGKLRPGSLRLLPGTFEEEATLVVTTRDVLSEMLALPADEHPISIEEPLTLGLLESGEPIEITCRQNSVLIAGMKGSGKSILLQVLIALLTRCMDAVIWMIDMAGGNTAKRWLYPWVTQQTDRWGRVIDRPVLDWVATTPEEATALLWAAHDIADERARTMRGGKINPTKDRPAIIVISEENSDLMAWAPKAVQPKTRGVKKGRKAAIDYVDVVQRGTGPNTGGGEINSQYDTVVGLKFNKKGEGQWIFPDDYGLVNLAQLPGKGALYIKRASDEYPQRGKAYFVNDDEDAPDIEEMAAARWHIRPNLDEEAQRVAEKYGYSSRWSDPERIGWLLDAYAVDTPPLARGTAAAQAAGATTTLTMPAPPAVPPTGAPGLPGLPPLKPVDSYLMDNRPSGPNTQVPSGAGDDGIEDAWLESLIAEAEGLTRRAAEIRTNQQARHDQADDDGDSVYEQPGDKAPGLLLRAHAAITAGGADRMYTADLAVALAMDAQQLGSELNALMKAVGVTRPGAGTIRVPGGEARSGYYAKTLEEAITAYRTR